MYLDSSKRVTSCVVGRSCKIVVSVEFWILWVVGTKSYPRTFMISMCYSCCALAHLTYLLIPASPNLTNKLQPFNYHV